MKKILIMLAAALAFSAFAFAKTPTPVVVDMQKLLQDYYKTADANLRLQTAQQTNQNEINKMVEAAKPLQTQLQDAQKKMDNPALTEEGKRKIADEVKPVLEQLQAKGAEIQAARQQAAEKIQQEAANIRATLIKDITEKVVAVAKQKNADMVLTLNAGVIWADSAYDITAEVLAALNAGQPKK